MKINLCIGNSLILSGYHNVDLLAAQDWTLPKVLEGECEELVLDDIINYIRSDEMEELISIWLKKIAIGGMVHIVTYDMHHIANLIMEGLIDEGTANLLIFGNPNLLNKKNMLSTITLEKFLISQGFQISSKQYKDTYKFSIKATRI